MTVFAISALRAVIEMLGWCLIGKAVLGLLGGGRGGGNPVYAFFDLVTSPPRKLLGSCLPKGLAEAWIDLLTFAVLFASWVGLAIMRKFI